MSHDNLFIVVSGVSVKDSIFFPKVIFKFDFWPQNTEGKKRLVKENRRRIPVLIQIFTVAPG